MANKGAKPGKGSEGRNEDANEEGRRKEKKALGLWKQVADSLKLGINSIYTNAVQAIKFGHSLSVVRSHWSDCKSYRIQKLL